MPHSTESNPTAPTEAAVASGKGVKVVRTCTIRATAQQLFDFWRDPAKLTEIIRDPVRIEPISAAEWEWSVSAPLKKKPVMWRSRIINERPPGLIAWKTEPGAEVPHAGTVRFEPAPGDEGTEVTVALEYEPPGGKLMAKLAKLSPEEPGHQVAAALRRLKALFEAGEIPTIEGQPVGAPQNEKGSS